MSGGYFDYGYYHLSQYKGQMEDPQLELLIEDIQDLLHSLEWYKSGDTDEKDYKKDVKKFKNKWLKNTNEIDRKVLLEDLDYTIKTAEEIKKRLLAQKTKEDKKKAT